MVVWGRLVQVKLDYLAAGVYRDDALSFIPTAEGRYIPPSPQAPGRIRFVGSYEYQQTDHRSVEPFGNLRTACQCGIKLDVATNTLVPVLLTEDPITLSQENHYDPWGLNLADIETPPLGAGGLLDWWQYNAGSEKSYLPDGSFDYDTDFRGYDPQIGRFKGVDALADALPGISTFQFGYNNPLSFQDPTGLISYTGGSSGGGGGWGGILGFGLNIAFNAIGSSVMQHTPTPRPVVQGAAINLNLPPNAGANNTFISATQPQNAYLAARNKSVNQTIANADSWQDVPLIGSYMSAFHTANAYDELYGKDYWRRTKMGFLPSVEVGLNAFAFGEGAFALRSRLIAKASTPIFRKLAAEEMKLVMGGSSPSKILGKNMVNAGITRPANTAAHHIVAATEPLAAIARRILAREGIDINAAENGVFLAKNLNFANPPAITPWQSL